MLLLHYPSHQSLATLEHCAKSMKKNIKAEAPVPGPVKNLV